jgi:hypothetical protein
MLDHQVSKFKAMGFSTFAVVSPLVLSLLPANQSRVTKFYVQEKPIGMGDALFVAREAICQSHTVLFTWVDQLGLTSETIRQTVEKARGVLSYVVPCLSKQNPYTGLSWGENGIIAAYETREGDVLPKDVVSDVGLFGFGNGEELVEAWDDYCHGKNVGAITGEVNFLQFLPWLTLRGWKGVRVEARVSDGLSVNTRDELEKWRRQR